MLMGRHFFSQVVFCSLDKPHKKGSTFPRWLNTSPGDFVTVEGWTIFPRVFGGLPLSGCSANTVSLYCSPGAWARQTFKANVSPNLKHGKNPSGKPYMVSLRR